MWTNQEKKRAYERQYYTDNLLRERERSRLKTQAIRARDPLKYRLRQYDLTPTEFERLHQAQSGRCAICLTEAYLVPDHDHKTGRVRGLLCNACNWGLGNFGDRMDLLERAERYLHRALACPLEKMDEMSE